MAAPFYQKQFMNKTSLLLALALVVFASCSEIKEQQPDVIGQDAASALATKSVNTSQEAAPGSVLVKFAATPDVQAVETTTGVVVLPKCVATLRADSAGEVQMLPFVVERMKTQSGAVTSIFA